MAQSRTTKSAKRPATFDHLKKKQPLERVVKVALDDASTVVLRFRAVGHKRYKALLDAHPPTDEQKQDENHPPYNSETFPIALIAASCVEPRMTEEQVQELDDEWNTSELVPLWLAAIEVNTQRREVS